MFILALPSTSLSLSLPRISTCLPCNRGIKGHSHSPCPFLRYIKGEEKGEKGGKGKKGEKGEKEGRGRRREGGRGRRGRRREGGEGGEGGKRSH